MNEPVNLFTVPTKYYKFANIFSKEEPLELHYLYNLQIKSKDGEKLPVGIIYLLPTTK